MDNAVKIAEHFWIFEENGVRSFLFEGERQALLVDTGFGTLPLKALCAERTDAPVLLVNTHTDRDHIGCNRDFETVYMHPAEMEHYQNVLPEGCRMEAVRPLWEGDRIELGYWNFEVLLTPGHTPGGIMLLEREKRMLISGDSVQDGDIYMFGPGRNMQALLHTLTRLIGLSDSFDTVWPSHGSRTLNKDCIPEILRGAQEVLAGKVPAQDPPRAMPCRRYLCDAVNFLYQP